MSKTWVLVEWREETPTYVIVPKKDILIKKFEPGDVVDVAYEDESSPTTIIDTDDTGARNPSILYCLGKQWMGWHIMCLDGRRWPLMGCLERLVMQTKVLQQSQLLTKTKKCSSWENVVDAAFWLQQNLAVNWTLLLSFFL
ncbi:hypothetical protein QTP86_015591 [Hemibagrus guttatus]|nr:hypothetical protein QTP86_015591 [Hemibagrus guttatus]